MTTDELIKSLPEQIELIILEEDLKKGIYIDPFNCPIAKAFDRFVRKEYPNDIVRFSVSNEIGIHTPDTYPNRVIYNLKEEDDDRVIRMCGSIFDNTPCYTHNIIVTKEIIKLKTNHTMFKFINNAINKRRQRIAKEKREKAIALRNKKIEETNLRFKNGSPNEKKVMIAQDVIQQLLAHKYIDYAGRYVLPKLESTIEDKLNCDLQPILNSEDNPFDECRVCGIGACMISAVKFGNTLKVEDILANTIGSRKTKDFFREIFTDRESAIIECAFEMSTQPQVFTKIDNILTYNESRNCINFGIENNNVIKNDNNNVIQTGADSCLIAIMQNIIDNDGELNIHLNPVVTGVEA